MIDPEEQVVSGREGLVDFSAGDSFIVVVDFRLEFSSAVREIAAEPDDFESYEDGIYFALLEDNEIVEGSELRRIENDENEIQNPSKIGRASCRERV